MTVADMIRELQKLDPTLPVWSLGMGLHGYAEDAPAESPIVEEAIGNKPKRVLIDGGCV
jgi:hypothetical protein